MERGLLQRERDREGERAGKRDREWVCVGWVEQEDSRAKISYIVIYTNNHYNQRYEIRPIARFLLKLPLLLGNFCHFHTIYTVHKR